MLPLRRSLLVALIVAVPLSACSTGTDTASDPAPSPTVTTMDPTSPSASTPPRSGPVAQAVTDLADALGVDEEAVEVVATEEVTWRDGSIGCAQRGMSYTQALTDGSRITLRVDGVAYEYHCAGSQPPFRCDRPTQ